MWGAAGVDVGASINFGVSSTFPVVTVVAIFLLSETRCFFSAIRSFSRSEK